MTRHPPRQRSAPESVAGARQAPDRSGTAERDRNGDVPASKPPRLAAGLYLTAVPIGNAGDITRRALDTLAAADTVACEDTRMTAKLLGLYGISRPLRVYHDHNADKMRPVLLRRIAEGEAVVLVSDAGMPLISDPGYKLVRAAHDQGLPVTCLPGANAPLTALVLSGLPSDRFLFAGFPPPRSAARRKFYGEFAAVPATLVFFESARRLPASLADLAAVYGGRDAAVTRELTKKFEQVRRGSLPELAAHYAEAGPPRGEVVVVVGPPAERPADTDPDQVDALLRAALDRLGVRDAAAEVAAATGLPRRTLYQRALALGRTDDG